MKRHQFEERNEKGGPGFQTEVQNSYLIRSNSDIIVQWPNLNGYTWLKQ